VFEAYQRALAPALSSRPPDITEENLQARIRGNDLMALSNKFGWLVLTTGNKSEVSVGYCTLYGDTAGGFAVLKDVYKTMIYQLARLRNERGQPIPEHTLTRAPSAELKPDQTDQDTLPPYDVLDPILRAYVEEDRSAKEIAEMGNDAAVVERVIRLVDASEYKRRQSPPGIKISPRAFGKDRRLRSRTAGAAETRPPWAFRADARTPGPAWEPGVARSAELLAGVDHHDRDAVQDREVVDAAGSLGVEGERAVALGLREQRRLAGLAEERGRLVPADLLALVARERERAPQLDLGAVAVELGLRRVVRDARRHPHLERDRRARVVPERAEQRAVHQVLQVALVVPVVALGVQVDLGREQADGARDVERIGQAPTTP
jgi:NAD+ synthetase